MTQNNKKIEWSEECQNAFDTLKHLLTTAPVLLYPSTTDKFILDTDASAYGVGAVLSQMQNGEEVVIAYGSTHFLDPKWDIVLHIGSFLQL